MKNKSFKWYFNYFLIGFINNLRNSIKSKNNNAYKAYKANRKILVNTYNPENWQNMSEGEQLSCIGQNLLDNNLIMQK